MLWLSIAAGGGLGAVARYALNGALASRLGTTFPWGIFVVNALGCLSIGLLAGMIETSRVQIGEIGRAFLLVGVLGGFTTFSSFGLDTFTLLRDGQVGLAVANAAGQVVVGLLAVWMGFSLAVR